MYLVSYDISSDRRRNKIAKTLEGYGVRIQYSVFECNVSEKAFKEMYRKLIALTEGMEDGSIRIYRLCPKCKENILTIGCPLNSLEKLKEDVIVI